MTDKEGHCVGSRQPTLPPISNKTLHHPSFMPLYMAADFAHHHKDCYNQPVDAISPAEFFYSDPTMSPGWRIHNAGSELMVIDCFKLNTPPPVMSACLAPAATPDPFRAGPHPIRDLGSLTFEIKTHQPPVGPSQVILQLTQEEDQAITNLLKLRYQEPVQRDMTLNVPQMDLNHILFLSHPEPTDSTSAEDVHKPLCGDVEDPREASSQDQFQQERCQSDAELEAANTLLSLMEEDQIWGQNHNKSGATPPDPLPCQHQGSETLPAAVTTDCTRNDVSFSSVWESGEPGWRDFVSVEGRNADHVRLPVCEQNLASDLTLRRPSLSSDSESRSSVCGGFSEVKERMLSDSEGDALHVLLSLGDMGVLDNVQSLSET